MIMMSKGTRTRTHLTKLGDIAGSLTQSTQISQSNWIQLFANSTSLDAHATVPPRAELLTPWWRLAHRTRCVGLWLDVARK